MQQDEQTPQPTAPAQEPQGAEAFFSTFFVPGFNPDALTVAQLQQQLIREAWEKARAKEVK